MPITEEQKRKSLVVEGYDPEKFEYDSSLRIVPKAAPVQSQPVQPQSQEKFNNVATGAGHAVANIVPLLAGALPGIKLGGMGGAKLGALTGTPVGAAIGGLGGALGGAILGSTGVSQLQSLLLPESVNRWLGESAAEDPMSAMVGGNLPGLLAFKPDFKAFGATKDLVKSIAGRATSGKNIPVSQVNAAGNVLGGAGFGVGSSLYDDYSAGRSFDPLKATVAGATEAVFNNPRSWLQKFGFAPNAYDPDTVGQFNRALGTHDRPSLKEKKELQPSTDEMEEVPQATVAKPKDPFDAPQVKDSRDRPDDTVILPDDPDFDNSFSARMQDGQESSESILSQNNATNPATKAFTKLAAEFFPAWRDWSVKQNPKLGSRGRYDEKTRTMEINPAVPDPFAQTWFHEAGHAFITDLLVSKNHTDRAFAKRLIRALEKSDRFKEYVKKNPRYATMDDPIPGVSKHMDEFIAEYGGIRALDIVKRNEPITWKETFGHLKKKWTGNLKDDDYLLMFADRLLTDPSFRETGLGARVVSALEKRDQDYDETYQRTPEDIGFADRIAQDHLELERHEQDLIDAQYSDNSIQRKAALSHRVRPMIEKKDEYLNTVNLDSPKQSAEAFRYARRVKQFMAHKPLNESRESGFDSLHISYREAANDWLRVNGIKETARLMRRMRANPKDYLPEHVFEELDSAISSIPWDARDLFRHFDPAAKDDMYRFSADLQLGIPKQHLPEEYKTLPDYHAKRLYFGSEPLHKQFDRDINFESFEGFTQDQDRRKIILRKLTDAFGIISKKDKANTILERGYNSFILPRNPSDLAILDRYRLPVHPVHMTYARLKPEAFDKLTKFYGPNREEILVPLGEMAKELKQNALNYRIESFKQYQAEAKKAYLDSLLKDQAPLAEPKFTPVDGVSYPKTTGDIDRLAKKYHNCLAFFGEPAARGDTFIVETTNAVAEIRPDGELIQHFGDDNSLPSLEDQKIMWEFAEVNDLHLGSQSWAQTKDTYVGKIPYGKGEGRMQDFEEDTVLVDVIEDFLGPNEVGRYKDAIATQDHKMIATYQEHINGKLLDAAGIRAGYTEVNEDVKGTQVRNKPDPSKYKGFDTDGDKGRQQLLDEEHPDDSKDRLYTHTPYIPRTTREVLEEIAKTNPRFGELANDLKVIAHSSLLEKPIVVHPKVKNNEGYYHHRDVLRQDAVLRKGFITVGKKSDGQTLIHEIVHGLTAEKIYKAIGSDKNVTGREYKALIDDFIKKNPKDPMSDLFRTYIKAVEDLGLGERFFRSGDGKTPVANSIYGVLDNKHSYGLTNPYEFLSEATMNKVFQQQLKAVDAPSGMGGWVKNAWDALIDSVGRIFGVESRKGSALDAALRVIEDTAAKPDRKLAKGQRHQELDSPQIETANFKKWFGESKVVDAEGKPLRVYHGTNQDFNEFQLGKANATGTTIRNWGHFFTPRADIANTYTYSAGAKPNGQRIIPVYLSIKKPKYITETQWDEFIGSDSSDFAQKKFGSFEEGRKAAQQFKMQALFEGHDGIIVRDHEGKVFEYIAFKPEQIKSAIGNKGDFDPTNPDIRAQDLGDDEFFSTLTARELKKPRPFDQIPDKDGKIASKSIAQGIRARAPESEVQYLEGRGVFGMLEDEKKVSPKEVLDYVQKKGYKITEFKNLPPEERDVQARREERNDALHQLDGLRTDTGGEFDYAVEAWTAPGNTDGDPDGAYHMIHAKGKPVARFLIEAVGNKVHDIEMLDSQKGLKLEDVYADFEAKGVNGNYTHIALQSLEKLQRAFHAQSVASDLVKIAATTTKEANWADYTPKPKSQMNDYVELSVQKDGSTNTDSAGHEFPDGTVVHVRGYMEKDADGKKVFYVVEVQSDMDSVAQQTKKSMVKHIEGLKKFHDEQAANLPEAKSTMQRAKARYLEVENKHLYDGKENDRREAKDYFERVEKDYADLRDMLQHTKGTIDKYKKNQAEDNVANPELANYQAMGIKAAIRHAIKRGADRIALSDAKSSMISQEHLSRISKSQLISPEFKTNAAANEFWHTLPNNEKAAEFQLIGDTARGFNIKVDHDNSSSIEALREAGFRYPREAGHRLNYEKKLPKIVDKLLGTKGQREEFGESKFNAANIHNADADAPILGESNWNTAGRVWDITPEKAELFTNEPTQTFSKRYQELDPSEPLSTKLPSIGIDNWLTSRVDAVRAAEGGGISQDYVAEKGVEYYRKMRYNEGKWANRSSMFFDGYQPEKGREEAFVRNLWEKRHEQDSTVTLTQDEAKLDKLWKAHLKEIAEHHEEIGMKIRSFDKTGQTTHRSIFQNPDYSPDMPSLDVIHHMVNNSASKDAKAGQLKQDFIEWAELKGNMNEKDAEAYYNNYIDAITGARTLKGEADATLFGALRKAQGMGLPWSWVEKNPVALANRYGRRVAHDFAFFEAFQGDVLARWITGLVSQTGEKPTKMPGYDQLNDNAAVQDLLHGILQGDAPLMQANKAAHARIMAAARVVSNSIMGVGTGIRDIFAMPAQASPYIRFSDLPKIFSAASRLSGIKKRALESGATQLNYDNLQYGDLSYANPDGFVKHVSRLSQILRKWGGRQTLENFSRHLTFALGEELAVTRIAQAKAGDKDAQKWLENFSKSVRWSGKHVDSGEEILSKIAKEFTDRVQGAYDAEGLPGLAIDSQVAPFLNLARWSIEKYNVIKKDVVMEAQRGNWAPLLKYTLGTLLSGMAVEELNQLLSGKRGHDPTMNEAFKNGDAGDIAYKVIGLAQLGAFAGIGSDATKIMASLGSGDVAYNNPLSFPLYSFITDSVAQNTADAISAIKDGADPLDTIGSLIHAIAVQSNQNTRYMNAFINSDETKRKERFRDLAVWKKMNGEVNAVSQFRANRFLSPDLKEFKRSKDVGEASQLLPGLIKEAIRKADNDPYKLKAELTRIKQNNYQTMPSPKSMPISFARYLTHLKKTQGEEAATERLQDYFVQNAKNKAKSRMVP